MQRREPQYWQAKKYVPLPQFNLTKIMILTIIVLYIFLKLYLEMEEEALYKYMVILCAVNLIPTMIYTAVSLSLGNLDHIILLIMALA